jgi:hypothetical protein
MLLHPVIVAVAAAALTQLLGWRGAALATPLVVGLAGSTFLVSQLVAGDATVAATALGGLLLAAGPAAGIVTQVRGGGGAKDGGPAYP